MPDLTEDEIANTDFGTYTEDQFFDDMGRVTEYRTDPELCELLVTRSSDTMRWMQRQGRPLHADLRPPGLQGRRQVQVLGRPHGRGLGRRPGPGRVALPAIAKKHGIEIGYDARALSLIADDDGVTGVQGAARRPHRARCAPRPSCWPAAASRPTPNGAPAISAPAGTSPRCAAPASTPATASAWRWRSAPCRPATGRAATRSAGTATRRSSATSRSATTSRSTPIRWGIMVNADGERFVDEGADFRNYTYAKYGRVILAQPGQFAWQVFDAKVVHLLRDEYRIKQVTKVARRHAGGARARSSRTSTPSARCRRSRPTTRRCAPTSPFDPNVKDGRRTDGPRGTEIELGEHHRHAAVRGLRGDLRHHLHLRRPQDRYRGRG